MGTLYIVSTPMGNLEDITLRALRILGQVELVATEDTRTTGRLLKHFNISRPLVSFHEYSKPSQVTRIFEVLNQGDVAIVSEAGTPLFSDPGYELVRAAIKQGYKIVSIPGPSALTAALPVSGLPTDSFFFLGFLPRKEKMRRRLLAEVATQRVTLVFFEAPHRLLASLKNMVDVLGPERLVAVCRELTKLHEEVWRGTLLEAYHEWQERPPRGEFTLVVAGDNSPPEVWAEEQVVQAVKKLIGTGATSNVAAKQVADQSGWTKKAVYALAIQVKKDDNFKK